jgi:hypothetical protein
LKISYVILAFVVLLLVIPATQVGLAQSTQASSTVNLQYLNIQVTYPSQVSPGDSAAVHVQASAKSSIDLVSLTAQVYYSEGTNLRQLMTITLASHSYMTSGKTLSKDIQVTVPQDAPRTSLFALFSENVQAYYGYSYYYYPYGYYSNYSYSCYHYYCNYYTTYYPAYYVSPYDYSTVTDDGLSSLSYIKATTPEYTDLQSQYQAAQQQLAQSQAQNQQLQQKLQDAQNANAQQNSALSDMNQQLNTARTMIGTWEGISLALAAAVIILGVLSVYLSRRRNTVNPEKVLVNKE